MIYDNNVKKEEIREHKVKREEIREHNVKKGGNKEQKCLRRCTEREGTTSIKIVDFGTALLLSPGHRVS